MHVSAILSLSCTLLAAFVNAADIHVTVGTSDGQNVFSPEQVTAAPGDIVHFMWNGGLHSVTQGALQAPCWRAEEGFDSGAMTSGTYEYTVVDVDPVWVFCSVGTHCKGNSMVFAINAVGTTFDQFKTNIQMDPPEGVRGDSGTLTTATQTGTANDGASTGKSNAALSSKSLTAWASIVGAVGSVVIGALIA